jgi:hypothetical protein
VLSVWYHKPCPQFIPPINRGTSCGRQLKQLNLDSETQINAWEAENMFFGGVNAVSLEVTGEMQGMGDRRRQGAWEKFVP